MDAQKKEFPNISFAEGNQTFNKGDLFQPTRISPFSLPIVVTQSGELWRKTQMVCLIC